MTIDKAIEILTALARPIREDENPDDSDALKLGIEALKRLEQNRTLHFIPSMKLLEGETDE